MDEQQAVALANLLGGSAWNSGGGIWLVRLERADGKLVVMSDETVCEYDSEEAWEASSPTACIDLL